VADSALYSADTLGKLAKSGLKWLTRVPATLTEAYEVLARADPSTMAPLNDGYRYQECSCRYAGVPQRWLVVLSHDLAS
jgi:transposase